MKNKDGQNQGTLFGDRETPTFLFKYLLVFITFLIFETKLIYFFISRGLSKDYLCFDILILTHNIDFYGRKC